MPEPEPEPEPEPDPKLEPAELVDAGGPEAEVLGVAEPPASPGPFSGALDVAGLTGAGFVGAESAGAEVAGAGLGEDWLLEPHLPSVQTFAQSTSRSLKVPGG